MLKKIALLSLTLFSTLYGTAQTQVVTGVMNGKDYGVTYTLPKTALKVGITATRTTYKPGEFAQYANRYLHLNNVQQTSSETWKLDVVKLNLIGIPDAEKVFFVKLKDKPVAPNIELTNTGVIKAINLPFKTVAPTPATATTAADKVEVDPKRFFTEEILMANSTAKIAELVAKEIYAIRESRNALLRGETEDTKIDGEFVKVMLQNMDEQESALLSLFTGRVESDVVVKNIEIETMSEFTNSIIARFSTKLGILDADDLAGEPILFNLKDLETIKLADDGGKSKKKLEGIAYNLPGRGYAEIVYNGKVISKGEFPITQFGTLEFLAPTLFNKKSTIQVLFDSSTGGLSKVNQDAQ